MNPHSLADYQRPTALAAPGDAVDILLHSCCAPCAGEIMEALAAAKIRPTVFFYNPNIHPAEEYEIRKRENIRFCEKLGVDFIDADYDSDRWFERTRGLENEPERGARCTACFDIRFERAAEFAAANGFAVFCSTLGISKWKDMEQINRCGERAASRHSGLVYWTFNWRKKGGSGRMIEIAKREEFYQQEYCGCVYSLRDSNRHRREQGRERIARGIHFYGRAE